jgi:hypothetical protein
MLIFINPFFLLVFLQLIQSEECGKVAEVQELSSEVEEDDDADDEEEGSGDESSGGGRTVTMTKMVEMRRALIVRLAPRRLTSSDEIMFEHSLLMSL